MVHFRDWQLCFFFSLAILNCCSKETFEVLCDEKLQDFWIILAAWSLGPGDKDVKDVNIVNNY